MPFRHGSNLVAGIDLPDHNMRDLRTAVHAAAEGLTGSQRIIVFGCEPCLPQLSVLSEKVATVAVRCAGQLPPAFIDYTLSRGLADGVALAGCGENSCYYRFGIQWTNSRLARERDPHLRARVTKDKVRVFWVGRLGGKALNQRLLEFANTLGEMKPRKPLRAVEEAEDQEQAHV
jgi:coenzyme F420-reducing hydrogenase delta subunit